VDADDLLRCARSRHVPHDRPQDFVSDLTGCRD